jgi:S1-C subfamily serine protease
VFLISGIIAGLVASLVACVTAGIVAGFVIAEYEDAATPSAPVAAPDADTDADAQDEADPTPLEAGTRANGEIRSDGGRVRFRLEVPADAVAIHVDAECDDGPLDLAAWFGDDDDGADAWTEDEAREQHLHLSEHATPDFAAGPLVLSVRLSGPASESEPAKFTIRADVTRTTVEPGVVGAGEISGSTTTRSGFRRTFAVRVPDGAEVARFDVVQADRDVDLFVDAGKPKPRTIDADWAADGPLCLETLVASADETPFPEDRVLSLTVVDPTCYDDPLDFRVLVSFSEEVPPELRTIEPLPLPTTPKDLALLASVELVLDDGSSGSGTIVRQDGYILTAAHVVDGAAPLDRVPTREDHAGDAPVVIAFSLDARTTSRDLYRGAVVYADPHRDVALVKILQGLRGQPLPKGHVFPAAPMARSMTVGLADEIVAVGYPGVGGIGSRNPITASRGTFSGFDRGARGLVGKTDALVSPGSSGGGAFDAAWTLTGVLVSTLDDGSGNALGYFVPIDEVPEAWCVLLRTPAPK